MNAVEVNNYVIEEMGLAEEQDDDAVVRFYLSNDELIEIWFDKDNYCYTWSNARVDMKIHLLLCMNF